MNGLRITVNFSIRVGSGTGPVTVDPVPFPLIVFVGFLAPLLGIMFVPIISTVAARLGLRGDSFSLVQASFASSDDIRRATGLFGLVLTIFFATSFTTALQRTYLSTWRRPVRAGITVSTQSP